MRFLGIVVFVLCCTAALQAQSLDVFGGRIDSSCARPARLTTMTQSFVGGSQNGTTQTIPLASASGWAKFERVIVSGTGTGMDTIVTGHVPDAGMGYISNIAGNTLTITLPASGSTVGSANGTIQPGFWHQGLVTSGPRRGSTLECTPLDHWKQLMGVAQVGVCMGGAGVPVGCTSASPVTLTTKYGTTQCGVVTLLFSKLASEGFNERGEASLPQFDANDSSCNTVSTGYFPGLSGSSQVSWYAQDNLNGLSTYGTVNETDAFGPSITTNISFVNSAVGVPDVFSPFYSQFVNAFAATNATSPWSAFTIANTVDDTDAFVCVSAGPDFHSIPVGHQTCNHAYLLMVTSPVSTLNNSNFYGSNWPQVRGDPKNYTKMTGSYNPFANSTTTTPPSVCNLTTPCSLQDYLCGSTGSKYATIAALVSAWGLAGGFYDTCGSDGTAVTGGTVGTGDGSTKTFAFSTHANLDPRSVAILIAGVFVGGDCPTFGKRCSASAGQGALMSGFGLNAGATTSITSGSCTYATGSCTVTFTAAPAMSAAITVDYIWGGWPRNGPGGGGQGLMDEDGSGGGSGTGIGLNGFCLISSSQQANTCAEGDQTAPTANATAGADLDAWVAQYAAQYLIVQRTAYETSYGLGFQTWLDATGAWSSPAHKGWLQAESQYATGVFNQGWGGPNDAESAAKLNFMAEYSTIPWLFETFICSIDGNGSCGAGSTNTEAQKGTAYYGFISAELAAENDGKQHTMGNNWWSPWRCTSACGGDFSDYGVNTDWDDEYNGHDDVTASVTCLQPTGGFTCGSESAGTWNGRDALGTLTTGKVINANHLWLEVQPFTPPAPTPQMLVRK